MMTAPAIAERYANGPDREEAARRAVQVQANVARLRRDFAYWARKCFKILDKNDQLRPFVLNPVQLQIEAAELEELQKARRARLFILKARQGGVTTHQQARGVHTIWSHRGAGVLTLAHDRETTDKIFTITSRSVDNFPLALLPRLGEKATREISFPSRDSRFYTGTAGGKRAGLSLTLLRFHGSEYAFWDNPDETLGNVSPALERDGTTMILETTGSGYGSKAHNFWREAQAGGNSYRPLFFPWWLCDRVHYRSPLLADDELGKIEPEEQDLIDRFGLDLEQIKWRREKVLDYGREKFLQLYAEDAESCWLATGGMFYDAGKLKALLTKAPTPLSEDMNGMLKIYGEPLPGERVIIGSDTAEGSPSGDGDSSTFVARAFGSWRLLSTFSSPRVEPKEFGGILDTWGRKYGLALLVIEKNMHGITVIRTLRDDLEYPVDAIYHRALLDEQVTQMTDRIGWATTGESKPLMLDAFREHMNAAIAGVAGVPCTEALQDAFACQRGADGKVDTQGLDMIVAEMLCWIGRNAPSSSGMLDFYAEQATVQAAAKAAAKAQTTHGADNGGT